MRFVMAPAKSLSTEVGKQIQAGRRVALAIWRLLICRQMDCVVVISSDTKAQGYLP